MVPGKYEDRAEVTKCTRKRSKQKNNRTSEASVTTELDRLLGTPSNPKAKRHENKKRKTGNNGNGVATNGNVPYSKGLGQSGSAGRC